MSKEEYSQKLDALLEDLQKKLHNVEQVKSLNELVEDNSLRIPSIFDKSMSDFLVHLKMIFKECDVKILDAIENKEYEIFWGFCRRYLKQQKKLFDKAQIFGDKENLEVIKEIFDNYIVMSSDKSIESINEEQLKNTVSILNTLVMTQMERTFSREKFVKKVTGDFNASITIANGIYDLINENHQKLMQKFIFKMLVRTNERLNTLEHRLEEITKREFG